MPYFPSTVLNLFPSLMSGPRLIDGGELQKMAQLLFGTQSGIVLPTAGVGTLFAAAVNQVASGTNGQLPPAIAGMRLMVINANATADLTVAAQTVNEANPGVPDLVNGAAIYTQAPGVTTYTAYALGEWITS
jgi:hypothetical protein